MSVSCREDDFDMRRLRAGIPTRARRVIGLVAWVALVLHPTGSSTPLMAQARFHVIAHERIDQVGGLQIVEIRDALHDSCVTLFVVDGFARLREGEAGTRETVDQAAADRDRRLAELSVDFTARSRRLETPGTAGPNPLAYDWAAQNVQFEYALRALVHELTRLEWGMQSIAALPTPCRGERDRRPAGDGR
jgi:hypothetical protein